MPSRRLLELLNLPATATKSDLRRCYLQRVKVMHPDLCTEANATERFAELQVAAASTSNQYTHTHCRDAACLLGLLGGFPEEASRAAQGPMGRGALHCREHFRLHGFRSRMLFRRQRGRARRASEADGDGLQRCDEPTNVASFRRPKGTTLISQGKVRPNYLGLVHLHWSMSSRSTVLHEPALREPPD